MNIIANSRVLIDSFDLVAAGLFISGWIGLPERACLCSQLIEVFSEVLPFVAEVAEFVGVELEACAVCEGFLLVGLLLALAGVFGEFAFVGAGQVVAGLLRVGVACRVVGDSG